MPELTAIQRRTITVLSTGQVLGGISFGATVSLGAVLAAKLSGSDALSGWATASVTLGTALTAVPLAALARRRGRRPALTTGMAVALVGVGTVIAAAALGWFGLLLTGFILIGAGQAANLQSRFAAADLATDASRGRDLSIVVWATTVGAVLGPNLVEPGESLGRVLGMPEFTGPYLFTVVGQLLGIALYQLALRPDPLLLAQELVARADSQAGGIARQDQPRAALFATLSIVGAHVVMVAIMAMTPIHLLHAGASLGVIGLTISLHIAGMYAAAPLFGLLADRWGRRRTIAVGYGILAASAVIIGLAPKAEAAITVALVLLGLGWSAATVAGSTLLTEASAEAIRTQRQGRNDFLMSLGGALAAVLAGGALTLFGFNAMAWFALPLIIAVLAMSPLGRLPARG